MALTVFQLPLFCLLPTHLVFIFIASNSIKHFQVLPRWCHCHHLQVHSILFDYDHVQNEPHGLPLSQTLPRPVEEARNPGFIPQHIHLFPYLISNLSQSPIDLPPKYCLTTNSSFHGYHSRQNDYKYSLALLQ